ncbi:hypothetical protein [Pedobacter agri]|uniref:hypothetical protein n=1 Tax=Pedobacter agri TaxID=454586 RepID=UPI00292D7D85|nr:hypothetical protein [Pedobacter agri]
MSSNSVHVDKQVLFDALDDCCQKIIVKMGGKPINEWRKDDYNALSSRLGKQTKVYLSDTTLKRIFGRIKTPQRYFPQKATRDALAQFVGFKSWYEFELVFLSLKKEETVSPPTPPLPPVLAQNSKQSTKRIVFSVIAFFLAVFVLLSYRLSQENSPQVTLICENPYGTVPHSAVFTVKSNHSIDNSQGYYIDSKEEALPAPISSGKTVTRFFKNPGVVYVTLFKKNIPIDTVSVCLQTKGWVANSGNDTSRAFPIAKLKPIDPANIYVPETQLDSAGLDLKKPFLLGFSNIHRSNVNGDNFIFSTKVFVEQSRPGVQCVETTLIILGEKDRHLITLFRKSCVALSRYSFSEAKATGTDQVLDKLAFDPENGGDVKLEVRNKRVWLTLNGKRIFITSYQKSIGKILGIKIVYSGIGKAVNPKIVDLTTGKLF